MWRKNSPDIDEHFDRKELRLLEARHQGDLLGNLSHEFYEGREFRERIVAWCSLVGCRTLPEDEMSIIMLVEYLRDEVGGLTLQEIEVALKMNLLQQFDEEVGHFQLFNVSYLIKIINKYKKYRLDTENKYIESLKKLATPKVIPFTRKERDFHRLNLVMQDAIEPPVVMAFAGDKWEWLAEIEWLRYDADQFRHAMEIAREELTERIAAAKDKSERQRLTARLNNEHDLAQEAKSMMYREYLEIIRGDQTVQKALCDYVAARNNATYDEMIETVKRGVSYSQSPFEEARDAEVVGPPPIDHFTSPHPANQ